MSYNVKSIAVFERQAKRLIKKHASLKKDMREMIQQLKGNPQQGTPLGRDCFKVRVAIKSKERGKSGGARVITCVKVIQNTVYLLSVYDKADRDTLSNKELTDLLKQMPE